MLTSYNLLLVTDILAASEDSTSDNKRAGLVSKALECLTPEQLSLAKKCHTTYKPLREHRNTLQHPRPSKDHSLHLLEQHRQEFSSEEISMLQACIHTSRRLPLPQANENQHSDLYLFHERPDLRTERLERNIKCLKEREARLQGDVGGHTVSGSGPLKRSLSKDENLQELDDEGHHSKKVNLSIDS